MWAASYVLPRMSIGLSVGGYAAHDALSPVCIAWQKKNTPGYSKSGKTAAINLRAPCETTGEKLLALTPPHF